MTIITWHIRTFLLVSLLTLFSITAWSTEYYSNGTGGGDWSTPATWSPSGPPACGDTVYIQSGDVIVVTGIQDYSACGQPMFLEIYGTLQFDGGGSKLRLPGGSGINVYNPNGLIEATGGGGGNSKNIQIGSAVVWNGTDPPVTGGSGFGTPLGIEVLFFEGNYMDGVTTLNWQTSGVLSGSFIVEKSHDNTNWTVVEEVESETTNETYYTVLDYEDDFEKAFFRLSFVDYSFNTIIYKTIIVLNDSRDSFSFKVVPNPTEGAIINLVIGTPEKKVVNAMVLDCNGHVVHNESLPLNEGNNLYSIYTKLKPFGMYYVTLYDDRHSATEKVVIAK